MPRIHAVVTMPYPTGLPRDVAQTTWSFITLDTTEETLDDVYDGLVEWWNDPLSPRTTAPGSWISTAVVRAECRVELYDVTTLPAGPPIYERTFTLRAPFSGSPNSLPLEVALVNSIRGAGTGPLRNRRGRQYIGPLNVGVISGASPMPRPDPGIITDMVNSSQRLASKDGTYAWFIWSRKQGEFHRVVGGFVNNEFDTQRRRGADETDRLNWSRIV